MYREVSAALPKRVPVPPQQPQERGHPRRSDRRMLKRTDWRALQTPANDASKPIQLELPFPKSCSSYRLVRNIDVHSRLQI